MSDKVKTLYDGTPLAETKVSFGVGKGRDTFVAVKGLQNSDAIEFQLALTNDPADGDFFNWWANDVQQTLTATHNANRCLIPAVHRVVIPALGYAIKLVAYSD